MTLRFDRLLAWVPMMLAIGFATPAVGALDVGQKVTSFTAPAAMAGKPFTYSLQEALTKGPVVLYFFPAAFSVGCSIEAHAFADAMEQFSALNASVIGVSTDDMETLSKFSTQACQGKFPVASDASRSITQSFDAVMQTRPEYANRISYVIAPNGKVVTYYQSLNPAKHVEKMLDAVRQIKK
ncbi:peroxiredoxin [Variovorax rhizosphaerae]|uniref:thioredoxin-dependent peroxiredoxin n=1 Tax=Variovorax rhizosphaerae TaxID=1836200 RepID=A0ABU8WPX7_9BURK